MSSSIKQTWKYATDGYWFRPGAEYSIGICRIALFFAIMMVAHNYLVVMIESAGSVAGFVTRLQHVTFYSFGVMKFFGHGIVPPAWFIVSCVYISIITGFAATIGFITRPSMIISVISLLFVGTLWAGQEPYWSHAYNVIFLAGLAFMFSGSAGSSLSVDALISRAIPQWKFGLATEKKTVFGGPSLPDN